MRLPVKRWLDRWNAYWFPRTTTFSLAVARIVAVAAQLFWFNDPLESHLNFLEKNPEFINPELLISAIAAVVSREAFFNPEVFIVLYWVTVIAGISALVGFLTRTSIFVFASGTWILIAHLYSYGDRHHPQAIFAIVLMLLAFAPSGESLSVDALIRRRRDRAAGRTTAPDERVQTAMWPLKLAHVLLAWGYFSTGITKIIFGGLDWVNGYTLQAYTFSDAINREIPLGIWLGQQHTLAILLSIFTVLFETFFFVSLILPWTAPFFFITGLFFQIGLFVTAGHTFFQHMVLLVLLLFLLAPPWWQALLNKYFNLYPSVGARQQASTPPGSSSGQAATAKAVTEG